MQHKLGKTFLLITFQVFSYKRINIVCNNLFVYIRLETVFRIYIVVCFPFFICRCSISVHLTIEYRLFRGRYDLNF